MNKQISRKSVLLWRIWFTALAVPLFFCCGVLLEFSLLWGAIALVIVLILYLLAVLYYFPRRYHSITYQMITNHLELQKGVFFQNILQLQFESVIYTKCTQTLLQRIFKICTLQLHPIGSAATIPQLSLTDAKILLNMIEETCHEV